jgi:drug/metabolite transporter (DMT)-like permease
MKQSSKAIGSVLLLVAAFIWGSAFVAQRHGGVIGAFTFNMVRSFIGCAALLIGIAVRDGIRRLRGTYRPLSAPQKKAVLIGGVLCGVVLGCASLFQQVGLGDTSTGNAGFITALYILIVPLLGLFRGKRVSLPVWLCIAAALVGLFLLSVDIENGFSVVPGDALVLVCAFIFSVHILLVDRFSPETDGVWLSCVQFFTAGIVSLVGLLCIGMPVLHEAPSLSGVLSAWFPLVYTGVLSSGVAYTFQILGQARTPAALASLIMSLESVFALLTAMVIDGEMPQHAREWIGCALMFVSVLLATFAPSFSKKSE